MIAASLVAPEACVEGFKRRTMRDNETRTGHSDTTTKQHNETTGSSWTATARNDEQRSIAGAGDAKTRRQGEEIDGWRSCRIGGRDGAQDPKAADDVQSRPLIVLRRFLGCASCISQSPSRL